MDIIDLDAIAEKIDEEGNYSTEEQFNKLCMKEAIHQALILASEKATLSYRLPDGGGFTFVATKQSILDVELLIK